MISLLRSYRRDHQAWDTFEISDIACDQVAVLNERRRSDYGIWSFDSDRFANADGFINNLRSYWHFVKLGKEFVRSLFILGHKSSKTERLQTCNRGESNPLNRSRTYFGKCFDGGRFACKPVNQDIGVQQ